MGPEEISGLTTAYENALKTMGLVDRNDPIAEMVAKKIIEIGQTEFVIPPTLQHWRSKVWKADNPLDPPWRGASSCDSHSARPQSAIQTRNPCREGSPFTRSKFSGRTCIRIGELSSRCMCPVSCTAKWVPYSNVGRLGFE